MTVRDAAPTGTRPSDDAYQSFEALAQLAQKGNQDAYQELLTRVASYCRQKLGTKVRPPRKEGRTIAGSINLCSSIIAYLRRGAPTRLGTTALTFALVVTSIGYGTLHFHCSDSSIVHLAVGHLGGALITVVALALIFVRRFRW